MSQRPFAGIRVRCSGQMRHYHRKPPPFNQSVTQPWHSSFSFSHPSFISPLLTSFVKETNYDAGWNLHESQVVEYLVDHVLTIMRCWDRKRTRKRVQRLEMKRRNVLLASDWQKQLVCSLVKYEGNLFQSFILFVDTDMTLLSFLHHGVIRLSAPLF